MLGFRFSMYIISITYRVSIYQIHIMYKGNWRKVIGGGELSIY